MSGFKEPDFLKRQEAAAIAKKAALEKFRAKAADPALADRLTERTARAAERKAIKDAREVEKAETKSRDTERAQQAELKAALQAERVKAEGAERERELEAKRKMARDARYAARKSRSKRL
jgi:Family of unknown function (DUF6481)